MDFVEKEELNIPSYISEFINNNMEALKKIYMDHIQNGYGILLVKIEESKNNVSVAFLNEEIVKETYIKELVDKLNGRTLLNIIDLELNKNYWIELNLT
tara:strand:+ start:237 stop:533 length:297 start_codon:yes stop_codon:yes gene_type:complete